MTGSIEPEEVELRWTCMHCSTDHVVRDWQTSLPLVGLSPSGSREMGALSRSPLPSTEDGAGSISGTAKSCSCGSVRLYLLFEPL